jgi:hypothetical protein
MMPRSAGYRQVERPPSRLDRFRLGSVIQRAASVSAHASQQHPKESKQKPQHTLKERTAIKQQRMRASDAVPFVKTLGGGAPATCRGSAAEGTRDLDVRPQARGQGRDSFGGWRR